MLGMEVILIIGILIVVYTYVGYGLVIFIINKVFTSKDPVISDNNYRPSVTFIVAAYNEEDCIEDKILNTLSLQYPSGLIKYIFVTDGSTDNTNELIKKYPSVIHLFKPTRKGKIAATKRAIDLVDTDIVVFSDANTHVNETALLEIVKYYQNPSVGAVACEKKVRILGNDNASATGEGFYWKYESFLKKQDSKFHSVVGAAGELFSIRTELFESIPSDTIIEDFYLTMRIAEKGFVTKYEPLAYAIEDPSPSVAEEYKRKIRIAAGGIQAIIRLKSLLNPFRSPKLSFVYISHRVLRWSIGPLLLLPILIISILLSYRGILIGEILTYLQLIFYLLALFGYFLRNKKLRIKIFYIPFYFTFMNYAVYVGAIRYFTGRQSVIWEKSKRMKKVQQNG